MSDVRFPPADNPQKVSSAGTVDDAKHVVAPSIAASELLIPLGPLQAGPPQAKNLELRRADARRDRRVAASLHSPDLPRLSRLLAEAKAPAVLQVGSRRDPTAVRELQRFLGLTPDGDYGAKGTAGAVRRFAAAHGITTDGREVSNQLAEVIIKEQLLRQSRRAGVPRIEQLLSSGGLDGALRVGSKDTEAVKELQRFLGVDDDGAYGPRGTAAAVRAYAKSQGITHDPPGKLFDGTYVPAELATILVREAAFRLDRDDVSQAVEVLTTELREKNPEALTAAIATQVVMILNLPVEQKLPALEAGMAKLAARLRAMRELPEPERRLSDAGAAAWNGIVERLEAAKAAGEPLAFARVVLDVHASALAPALAGSKDEKLARAAGELTAAFHRSVVSDQAQLKTIVGELTAALRRQHPDTLRVILRRAEDLERMQDRPGRLSAGLERSVEDLARKLERLRLEGPAEEHRKVVIAAIRQARDAGTALPLARATLPVFLDALAQAVPGEEAAVTRNDAARIAALRQSLVQAASLGVTPQGMRSIVPSMSLEAAKRWAPVLNGAMDEFDVGTPQQRAAFLAQLAHESGGFRFLTELGNKAYFERYQGREDLGNTVKPDDGFVFRGRGLIQITGRHGYTTASRALFGDDRLVEQPELAAEPVVAARIAAWFWRNGTRTDLNDAAEAGDFKLVTRRINGGYNGLDDRLRYYGRAMTALGVS